MEEIIIDSPRSRHGKKNEKPTVIKWQGAGMVRNHSIRAVADEIKNMSNNQDLISINVIGKQSTGKTELCKTLAHLVHQMSKKEFGLNYNVSRIGREEFINLEEFVATLKPTNHILIFDDIAFLKAGASSKQVEQIQSILAEIRHLPGGKDVRIIIFKSFQYSKALPPFLRQNDMTFVSSVDDNEEESLIKLLGIKQISKIKLLKRLQTQVKLRGRFDYPLGNKETNYFKYNAKKPFLPYLYWNGDSLRIIVSPLRTWIDPICQTCDNPKSSQETMMNLEEFMKDFCTKFGDKHNAKQIVKIKLLQTGVNCYPSKIVQGMKYLDKYLAQRLIALDDLRQAFELEPTETRLHKSKVPVFKDE